MADELKSSNKVKYFAEPTELIGNKTPQETEVASTDFIPAKAKTKRTRKKAAEAVAVASEPYLIIGFDTEFKTPEYHVSREQIVAGEAKYRVLSYQFHAKTSDGHEWQGICCPDGDERMTLGEFVVFALGLGARDHQIKNIPTKIYLVGHFTRADVPAFADFQDLTHLLSSVRNTFISIDSGAHLRVDYPDGSASTSLNLLFRDTMLLTPQASKSLKEIGKLVGQEKMQLDPDEAKHKDMIRNMDKVRVEHWDLFKRYALNDATICVRYIEKIIDQFEQITGKKKVPVTLTSIGVDLLQKSWKENLAEDALTILGKEEVTERYFDKKKGYFVKNKKVVDMEEVAWYIDFITESYHGGRNEQFWFGPCFEDDWTDYDLSSAYPTAMSLIGMPKWHEVHDDPGIELFTPTTLGFANVDFEFPAETRYPTLPVRTNHGLIFPLTGKSYCSAPELFVARKLGATIKINKGVIVPSDPDIKIFGLFIKDCLERRKNAGTKKLESLFWKEISNSTYGKTAQGLRPKRVYDMRDRATKILPPSAITNPFFASYITSFTRAIMGEIINNLDRDTCVFSCTTDGFISNAGKDEIKRAQEGELSKLFLQSRELLTGLPSVLETKHFLRKPLGWRTRGQATLMPGVATSPDDEDKITVLAKGGIFTPPECESTEDQNNEIIRMFFSRTPDSLIRVEAMTGIRDMVEHDADLVEKVISKKLNMEYDWKRQPLGVGFSQKHQHLIFSTRPWHSLEQFVEIREAWDDYTQDKHVCLKTPGDYEAFASSVEAHSFLTKEHGKYLKKINPDIQRLRQLLCSAWRESKAGLSRQVNGVSAQRFADLLINHDIPCKRSDVENANRRPFVPHSCPPTNEVLARLKALKQTVPDLDIDLFLYTDRSADAVTLRSSYDCPFIRKCY
jgi:hypothetical protein